MGSKVTVKDVNFGIDEKVSNRPKAVVIENSSSRCAVQS